MKKFILIQCLVIVAFFTDTALSEEPSNVYYADYFVTHSGGFEFINVSNIPRNDGVMLKFKDSSFSEMVKIHLSEMNLAKDKIVASRIRSFVFSAIAEVSILKSGSAIMTYELNLNESRYWTQSHKMPDRIKEEILGK